MRKKEERRKKEEAAAASSDESDERADVPRRRGRRRSKTPMARGRPLPVDTAPPSGEKEEVESQGSEEAVPSLDSFWLSWIFVLVLSIVLTTSFGITKTTIDGSDKTLAKMVDFGQAFSILPGLICVYGVYVRATVSDYTNRVAALNLWVAMVALFEVAPAVVRAYGGLSGEQEIEKQSQELLWFALGWWQVVTVFTVNAAQTYKPSLSLIAAYCIAVVAGLVYVDANTLHVTKPQWLVLFCGLFALGNSTYSLMMKKEGLKKWLEFYGVLVGVVVVWMHLLRAGGYHLGKVETTQLKDLTLKMDSLWFSEQLMRWVVSLTFTISAFLDD